MTIGKKIGLTCAALVGLTAILSGVSIYSMKATDELTNQITGESLPGLYQSGLLRSIAKDLRGKALEHVASQTQVEMDRIEEETSELRSKFEEAMRAYEGAIVQEQERLLFAKVAPAYEKYKTTADAVRGLSRENQNVEALKRFQAEARPALAALVAILDELGELNKANADQYSSAVTESSRAAITLCVVLSIVALITGGGLAFLVVRSVNSVLRQSVAELGSGAEQVAAAAGQVSTASQSLAQGTSEQAASLEETSSSSQEIAALTQKNADNARMVAEEMMQAQQLVGSANQTLAGMVASMGEINNASDKIARIIKVIDEIAFQTNILALNAAVEAARAGDAGMGFAVVADEVRSLAQRSAQAAKDTAVIIEESIAKSSEGSRRLDEVNTAIAAVTTSAGKVKTLVDEVSAGNQEQARGIEEITKAISQMEQVTQETAANAEESASASEELNSQAEAMREVVQRLSQLVDGGDRGRKGFSGNLDASKFSSGKKAVAGAAKGKPGKLELIAAGSSRPDAFVGDDDLR